MGIKYVTNPANAMREARVKICFPVINRGKLWYDRLSREQLVELKKWYQAWLDAPDTLIYPVKPVWIDDKLDEEEILL